MVEELSRGAGIMLMQAVMESEGEMIAGKKNARNPDESYFSVTPIITKGQEMESREHGTEVGSGSSAEGREEIQTSEGCRDDIPRLIDALNRKYLERKEEAA